MSSLTKKQLRVTFILAGTNQKFPGTDSNTLVLTGLRVSAKVQAVARLSTNLDLRVFGMLPADMAALTVAWANPPIIEDHLVLVEAKGNADPDPTRGWSLVFKGTILEAQPEYRAQPDVYFGVLARTGYHQQIQAAAPTSYPYSVDIGVAADDIGTRMGFKVLVSPDVTGTLSSPYFTGTLSDQLAQACRAANTDFYFLGDTIFITKAGTPFKARPAVLLNADSGLVGYPVYERAGLEITAVYDPAFTCGTAVELSGTPVPSANGRWNPIAMTHTLECELPKGQWFTQLQCLRVLV